MEVKIKLWLIRVLRGWLRKLGWPGFEPVTKTMPAQILTIEVRAIRPVGENASSEYLNDILASGLGKEAFKYAKISDEPEEFDSFPCRRAYLRVVPFEKNVVPLATKGEG